jgi:hypothetical protein
MIVWRLVALFLCAIVLGLTPPADAYGPSQGFGATTEGGARGAVYHVTTLNDSGPGSLRDAVSAGNRLVVFDVAGDIALQSEISVNGAFITVDGLSAPPPGITLRGKGLIIRGNRGAHDVIIRGLRVRGASYDGIQIAYSAYNILIEHVSVQGSYDGNIDVTESSRDVTVAWSVFAQPADLEKNMLIKYKASRVTLHHNLLVTALQRNPQIRVDDAGGVATELTVDMRNNVIWDWRGGVGTVIWHGPWVNVVNNLYGNPAGAMNDKLQALEIDETTSVRAYVAGNVSADGVTAQINAQGTQSTPFAAPLVDTQDACTAGLQVLAQAGVRPLDSVDQTYLAKVNPSATCGGTVPPVASVAFSAPANGGTVSGSVPMGWTSTGLDSPVYRVTVDGAEVYNGTATSYGWSSTSVANGSHQLTVTASDASGASATSSIAVAVSNGSTAPITAAITSPGAGSTVTGMVNVAMNMAGAYTVPVTFRLAVDGLEVNRQTPSGGSATYAWNTSAVANGSHTVTLTVTDAGGRSASDSRTVTVSNSPSAAFTVSFTAPSAGATLTRTVNVGMAASSGARAPVTFALSVDGVALSTTTVNSRSASYAWNTLATPNGSRTLSVTATDASGRSATATRSVKVSNTPLVAYITTPPAGSTVTRTATIGMAVTGAVTATHTFAFSVDGVEVWRKTVPGTTTSFAWNTYAVANGSRTVTLTVTDGAGRVATTTRTLVVANAAMTAAFTTPSAGATVRGTIPIGMSVTGAASSSNQFSLSIDGQVVVTKLVVGTTTTSHTWNTTGAANGTHTLRLTVTDSLGRTSAATRTVTVAN